MWTPLATNATFFGLSVGTIGAWRRTARSACCQSAGAAAGFCA